MLNRLPFNTGIVLGALLCTPVITNAAIVVGGYGAEAATSTASNCPSFCTTAGGGDFQFDSDGGEFSSSAFSEESTYALGRAQASLTGTTYLPDLKVLASSDVGKGGGATAFGVQGFTYTGGSSTSITLNLDLHGSITDNPTGYVFNQLSAGVAVLIGPDLGGWIADFGTMVYELASGLEQAGVVDLSLSDPGLNQNDLDSISFDIDPGEHFFVIAEMNANGQNGIADGWNTLTLNFDDDTGLVAASAVPVPAAVWLFGSGLLGLAGLARRQRQG